MHGAKSNMSATTENETSSITSNQSLIDNKPSIKEVLKNKPFMVLFGAQFIENVGRAISGLALEFFIWELTRSPLKMGILAILWLLPFVIIAPFAGVYTDRLDQRKIMFWSNVLSMIASLGYVIIYLLRNVLTFTRTYWLVVSEGRAIHVTEINYGWVIWPLFIFAFLNSASAAFFFPARSAYTRLIVKKKNLLIANSIGSTIFQIATIVGFVIAGILAAISYLTSFIFDASTFLVSGLLILVIIRIGKKPPKVEREKSTSLKAEMKGIVKDMRIGYRTIRDYPKISYMLVIFSAITFTFGAINVLFIVILQGEMGLNQMWYGALQGVMGASGIITAIILMSMGKIKRKILLLNGAFLLATIAMYLFAVIRNPWGMAAILFSFGVITVCINIPASTLIQETVPYEKQGRVFGTQQLVQGIAQLIGMGIVAIIAEYVLPMITLLVSSGILTIIIVIGFIYSGRRGLLEKDYDENGDVKKARINNINKQLEDSEFSIEKPSSFTAGDSSIE